MVEKVLQDILDFGVSTNAENAKQSLFTNYNEDCNPPKRRRNSDEVLLLKRMSAATAESINLKVQNMKDKNAGKREYSVSNGLRVSRKRILFLLRCVLRIDESDGLLKNEDF